MPVTVPPWSYTAIATFENCPKQYYHRYILKERSPDTEQTKHGTSVHKAMEDRLRDKIPLPEAYQAWEPFCVAITKQPNTQIEVEKELAINSSFKPCGFFSANVWGRGKADVVVRKGDRAWVGDWKTGKPRENEFQLKIFGAFIFKMHPEVQEVSANNIWLQCNDIGPVYTFKRHQEGSIWADILHKISRIELAAHKNIFSPKASGLCGYCEVSTCPHNQRRN